MDSEITPDRFSEYLVKLGERSNWENAFHSLLELDVSWLPRMVSACQAESDPLRKSRLVEVVWRSLQPSVITFLCSMLKERSDAVWQAALNGLVEMGNASVIDEINDSLKFINSNELKKIAWIQEAIEQIREK